MASIMNGLFAGRAGIASHGTAIAVLADNIANSNTVAYKTSRAEFTDLLAGNISGGGGGASVGSGSSVDSVTQIFNQGTFEFTGRGLDLGIDGQGFFVLSDNGARFYSRAGNLKIDADGRLLNQNGLEVMGFPANGSGGLESLNVNSITATSARTQNVTITGNLNATITKSSGAYDVVPGAGATFAQLSTAASFSTYADIYDSLGGQHTVTVYFFHTAQNTWVAQGYVDGNDIQGGTAGVPVQLTNAQATLTFSNSGLRTVVPVPPAADFDNVTPPTGAPYSGWKNGADSVSSVDFTFDPFTQFSSPSNINSISQDGKGQGNIVSFNVEQNGNLFALLDNGQTTSVGVIALATFSNPEGLRRNGESLYTKTTESGEAVIGTPNIGQFGAIQSGALELSTSDIASDFIKLISLQRGFQGSSRVITSIDDLLSEVINLAR